jgi:hypothetical protein
MNWLPQESVSDSVKPGRYTESALWLLGEDGYPIACVHYEHFNSWGENKPVFGVSMQTDDGWMCVQPLFTTDKAKAIAWAESELERQPPRQMRMF